jgi:hypothetical protein
MPTHLSGTVTRKSNGSLDIATAGGPNAVTGITITAAGNLSQLPEMGDDVVITIDTAPAANAAPVTSVQQTPGVPMIPASSSVLKPSLG